VILQGVQAHASQPEKGLNAVYAADAFIREVRALHGETIGYCATGAPPPFSPTTLNVTKISAGSAYNIVPGQCTLGVDIRFVPGETVAQWTDRLGAIALRLRDQGLCTGYEVVVQDAQDPFVISEDNRVIQAIDASVAALTGQRCARITMNGTTVCKQLVQHNIPAVGWSMDGADQAHMANEHLALSEIPLFGTALGLVFLRLCEAW
jgi:succinyl-diaminopimelate desuccinylase